MNLISILNSNLVVAVVTLLTGYAAYLVYKKQNRDLKKDAANIILLEIQNAERILTQVGESVRGDLLPNKLLLSTDSWSKYKYLFVRDFDRDEWDTITQFYSNCKLYDEAVIYNNSMFQKNEEQIRVNMLRVASDYLQKCLEPIHYLFPDSILCYFGYKTFRPRRRRHRYASSVFRFFAQNITKMALEKR